MGRHAARYAPPVFFTALALTFGAVVSACTSPADDVSAAAVDGRAVFDLHCAACHGVDGRGTVDLTAPVFGPGQLSDADAADAVRTGAPQQHANAGPMPAFPQLSDAEIDAVIAHLRDLQDAG